MSPKKPKSSTPARRCCPCGRTAVAMDGNCPVCADCLRIEQRLRKSPKTAQPILANFSYLHLSSDATPSRRESDAYHESGHATVAVLLGVAIDVVELLPEGSNPSAKFRFGIVKPNQCDAVVVIAKSGLWAELAFNPSASRTPRKQDELIAARACRGKVDCLFPAARAAFMRAAELQALRLVAENLPIIKALAQCLLEKGRLSGKEVTGFVRQRISGASPDSKTDNCVNKKD